METLTIKRTEYQILSLLYEDEDRKIYLANYKGKKYSISIYKRNFPLFFNKIKRIQKCGIPTPKIVANSKPEGILVREYFEGPNVFEEIAKGPLSDNYYKELFLIYRFCRFSQINLNYLPENFIMRNNKLYYISDDIYDYEVKHNLENWGIYYWFYGEELVNRLRSNGYKIDNSRILSKAEETKKITLTGITYW